MQRRKRLGQQEADKLHSLLTRFVESPSSLCLATWSSLEFKPSAHSANTVALSCRRTLALPLRSCVTSGKSWHLAELALSQMQLS